MFAHCQQRADEATETGYVGAGALFAALADLLIAEQYDREQAGRAVERGPEGVETIAAVAGRATITRAADLRAPTGGPRGESWRPTTAAGVLGGGSGSVGVGMVQHTGLDGLEASAGGARFPSLTIVVHPVPPAPARPVST